MKSLVLTVLAVSLAALLVAGCTPKAQTEPEGTANKQVDTDAGPDTPATKPADDSDDHDDHIGEGDDKDGDEKGDEDKVNDSAAAPTNMAPAAYRDKDGQLLCPVMGVPIESEDKAVGFQDHNNVRYYFCCGDCPKLFKKDPDQWLKN